MNRIRLTLAVILIFTASCLSSCSGPINAGGGGGGNNGTANFTVTVTDAPPIGISVLSFNVPIRSVFLTSSTGTVVNVFSPTSPIVLDMIRLQSDSAILGTAQVPADTYNSISIQLDVVNAIIANSTGATIGTCAANSVCSSNSGTPGVETFTFATPLTVVGNTNIGLNVDFKLSSAVTATGSLDFSAANIPNIITLSAPVLTGNLSPIEDFTGTVTAFNSTTGVVTIASGLRGTLTGTVNSSTTYHAVNTSICGGNPGSSCLSTTTKRTISVDGTVSTSGAVTITEVDFLDDPSADAIEGVIYKTSTPGTYNMIVSDKVNPDNNALLTPVSAGAKVAVTLDTTQQYDVDTRNLLVSVPSGFSSSSDISDGQEVFIHVKSATAGTLLNIVTDRLVLRFTRVTGFVNVGGPTSFTFQQTGLPAFFGTFNSPPTVLTVAGVTAFDGGITSPSQLSNGDIVSIRALFLPNNATFPFQAAKVRKH